VKAVVQRVKNASVIIGENVYSEIGQGLLILLGIFKDDSESPASYLAKKIIDLRIFSDENDKMNLSLKDINGEALVISQFTLCTDDEKSGNRPSFFKAESPDKAKKLYDYFIKEMKNYYESDKVREGEFAATMKVNLVNDGPVTIILDKN
jgi:D-tyrosyl-tRNA(Tyr) deacylase